MSRRAAIVTVSLFIIAAVVLVGFFIAVRPARYDLLDSRLGPSAWKPAKLVEVLSWRYQENHQNPYALRFPEFFDFQQQALLRILDIQQHHFRRPAPPRQEGGTYIDHSYVRVMERTGERVVVIGIATLDPCRYDESSLHGPDPYWQMERFTFTPAGELLSREAHTLE